MNQKNSITLVVHIPVDLHTRLKLYCVKNRFKIQDVVAELIEKKIKD